MVTKAEIDDFVAQKSLAVVGISRSGKGFGGLAYRELKGKGVTLFPVHPEAKEIEGDPCYPSLKALPSPVGGVLVVTPPRETEQVVRDAVAAGITRVWLQQGAASEVAIGYCRSHGVSVIANHCILMFASPSGFPHSAHRFFLKLFGKMPR